MLNGIFAFVLFDREEKRWLIARDPIGVVPLYWGRDEHGNILVASEVKALTSVCRTFQEFPAGHYWDSADEEPVQYYQPQWRDFDDVSGNEAKPKAVKLSMNCIVFMGWCW